MAFTKQNAFTKKTTDLPDIPSTSGFTPTDIKTYIQTPADELKTTVNKLVDDLNTDGWVDNSKLAPKSVNLSNLSDEILNQPKTTADVQIKLQQHDEQLEETIKKSVYNPSPFANYMEWLPTAFQRYGSNAVLTKPGTITELGFPTVIKVKDLIDNPIDDYYMWVSPHDEQGGGCFLYTAPTPTGPWTIYSETPIVDKTIVSASSHISSFHWVWVEEESRFYVYFHASGSPYDSGQGTFLGYSTDGINVTLHSTTPVLSSGAIETYDDLSATYFRAFRKGKEWFGYYQCEDANSNERGGFASSVDGKVWEKYYHNPVIAPNPKDGETLEGAYLPTPIMIGNTCYVLFVARRASDGKLVIKLATTTDGVTLERHGVIFEPSASGWDSYDVTYPYVFFDGSRMYLYYVGNNASDQSGRNVGIAYIDLEVKA